MSKSKSKLVSDSFFFHHFTHHANVLPILSIEVVFVSVLNIPITYSISLP
jgi:uncharacterized membrane protein YiaA